VLSRVARSRDRHQLRVADLVINTLSREVTVGGRTVALSAKEYQLVATLAAEPERVFTKRELLESVWDFKSPGRTRTLDSHASRLRQKLAEYTDTRFVVNVWGVGYRLHTPR
jgi:DNA-binding response OmpR family regulator